MKNLLGTVLLLGLSFSLLAESVPHDPNQIRPLLPGQQAPEFSAIDARGETFRFDPAALERPAVIIFYRGGWCPFCNLYWAELRKFEDQLMAMDLDLIFLSADSAEVIAEAMVDAEDQPEYHLLSDSSSEIAAKFGIAFRLDDATYERYVERGVDLEVWAGGYAHHNLPVPATFIVGTDGVIRFQYVNPNYKVRLHPEVLLAAARTMPEYEIKRPEKD